MPTHLLILSGRCLYRSSSSHISILPILGPQWVGGVAVEMAGGPAVPLLPGRHDCGCFDNSTVLPDECSTLEELAHFWGESLSAIHRAYIQCLGMLLIASVRSAKIGVEPIKLRLNECSTLEELASFRGEASSRLMLWPFSMIALPSGVAHCGCQADRIR